ncbi:hypothetical protein VN0484_11990 [Helicobacter pylori]|nr:hypothetical protein VN0484_11990 [Helicobacter pylori]
MGGIVLRILRFLGIFTSAKTQQNDQNQRDKTQKISLNSHYKHILKNNKMVTNNLKLYYNASLKFKDYNH